jgi:hypothetical protein
MPGPGGVSRTLDRVLESHRVHFVLCDLISENRIGDLAVAAEDVLLRQFRHRFVFLAFDGSTKCVGNHRPLMAEKRFRDRPARVLFGDYVRFRNPDVLEVCLAERR